MGVLRNRVADKCDLCSTERAIHGVLTSVWSFDNHHASTETHFQTFLG